LKKQFILPTIGKIKIIFDEEIMLKVLDVDLTPNPQALKFVLNEKLLSIETRSFKSKVEALKKINEIIDLRIKPALAGDGGGLEVLGLEDNTLTIRYQGACGTCPSSIRGTLVAIENLLRREVNEDLSVISG
jgi:Fe-S cluster biogenesis protein NfuA